MIAERDHAPAAHERVRELDTQELEAAERSAAERPHPEQAAELLDVLPPFDSPTLAKAIEPTVASKAVWGASSS